MSYGTVKNYALQGLPLPEGWLVDRLTGAPITDAARSVDGVLMPIGGYKGAGLALVLGLLAGPLNGAAFGREVVDFNSDQSSETNTGHFIIALDIGRFIDRQVFGAEVDRHVRELRASARIPEVAAIRLPGDERQRRRAIRSTEGVPLTPVLRATLDRLGAQLGIGALP